MEEIELPSLQSHETPSLGWIYFIQLITEESLQLYKIGYTINPNLRMAQHWYKWGWENQIRLLNYRVMIQIALVGEAEKISLRQVENAFHSRFHTFRVNKYRFPAIQDPRWFPSGREWFSVSDEVVLAEMFTLTHLGYAQNLNFSDNNHIKMLQLRHYPGFYFSNPLQ